MHKTKIDYLRGHFSKEDCFSAITNIELDYMTVGTPVMVDIKPFVPNADKLCVSAPSLGRVTRGFSENRVYANTRADAAQQPERSNAANDADSDAQQPVPQRRHSPYDGSQPVRIRQSNSPNNSDSYKDSYKKGARSAPKAPNKKDIKKTSVKDLYEMGIVKANKVLQNKGCKANTMFVFSFYKDYRDYYTHALQSHQVYFDGKKPLVYDEGRRFELERLSDVYKKGDLNNFAEMIASSLKEDRYINYSFGEVNSLNKRHMFEDINIIFNNLKKVFPKNFSFFKSMLNNGSLRSLVDTISISFYRMQDVIAIFDSKKTSGMGVEIFLTNSIHKPIDIGKSDTAATYRFLFSKSRENVFTIDGELIKRQYNGSTNDVLNRAFSVISTNIPIVDSNAKKSKLSRRSICVE